MMHRNPGVFAAAAATLCASGVCAASLGGVEFSVGGFGTLGVVHSNEHQADFVSSLAKPTGAGFSHDWSSDVDSLIGAQLTATYTPQFSAVVQVISEQNADGTYKPSVEWANIKYQPTDDFSARVGRVIMPFLLFSETRKVAYAQLWVRLPLDVYSLSPLARVDGVDVSYRVRAGDWSNSVQGLAGTQDVSIPGAGTVKARNIAIISDTTEWGALTVRLVYQQARASLTTLDPLFNGFRQFGPQGISIADNYNVDNKRVSVFGAGASYDPGNWIAIAEWVRVSSRSILGTTMGWYASGGYRFGNFTPYGIVAQTTSANKSDPGLNTALLPPSLAPPANLLNGALNSLLQGRVSRNTLSAGARWDFFKNADFKVQYDHIRIGAGSDGGLTDIQPGFRTGPTVGLISATVDFVF
jgi:hypothetical protein